MGGLLDGVEELKQMAEGPKDKIYIIRQDKNTRDVHVFDNDAPYDSLCGKDFKTLVTKGDFRRLKSSYIKEEIDQMMNTYDKHSCNECKRAMRSLELESTTELSGILLEWNRLESVRLEADL